MPAVKTVYILPVLVASIGLSGCGTKEEQQPRPIDVNATVDSKICEVDSSKRAIVVSDLADDLPNRMDTSSSTDQRATVVQRTSSRELPATDESSHSDATTRKRLDALFSSQAYKTPYRVIGDLDHPISVLLELKQILSTISPNPSESSVLCDLSLRHLEYRNSPNGIDPKVLETLVEDAKEVFGESDPVVGRARVLYATHLFMGSQTLRAIKEFKEALQLLQPREESFDDYLLAITRLAQALLTVKQVQKADALLAECGSELESRGIEPTEHFAAAVHACVHADVKTILKKQSSLQGTYDDRIRCLRSFFPIKDGSTLPVEVIRQYGSSAKATRMAGNYAVALALSEFAYAHAKTVEGYPDWRIDNLALGLANSLRYDGRMAEVCELLKQHPLCSSESIAISVARELGSALCAQRRYEEAIKVLEPYVDVPEKATTANLGSRITAVSKLATCYGFLGQKQKALQVTDQFITEFRRLHANSTARYGAESNAAVNYLDLCEYEKSLVSFKAAAELMSQMKVVRDLEWMMIHRGMGLSHTMLGQTDAAQRSWLALRDFYEKHWLENPGLRSGRVRGVFSPYGLLMLEPLRRNAKAPNTADAIEAWQLLDRLRSPGLAFEIFCSNSTSIGSELLNQRKAIALELQEATENYSVAVSQTDNESSRTIEAKKRLAKVNLKYASFEDTIRRRLAGEVRPIELSEVQSVLRDDEAIIGYVNDCEPRNRGKKRHWGVVVRNSGAPSWIRLSGSGEFREFCKRDSQLRVEFVKAISTDPRSYKSPNDWKSLGRKLRKIWFAPLEKELNGISHVYDLRSGFTQDVPLATITSDFTFTSIPSVGVLLMLKSREPNESGKLFAVGGHGLDGARTELNYLASKFQHKVVLEGNASNEANFFKNVANGRFAESEYIHFALHGEVNIDRALDASLTLGPAESGVALFDGQLSIKQMMKGALNAPCRLMVLSACETDRGASIASEGEIGLGAAALVAGSQNVISTRWPIDDFATNLLMNRLYDNLIGPQGEQRLSIAEALSRAQNWTKNLDAQTVTRLAKRNRPSAQSFHAARTKFDHPYFWAGFIHTGAN